MVWNYVRLVEYTELNSIWSLLDIWQHFKKVDYIMTNEDELVQRSSLREDGEIKHIFVIENVGYQYQRYPDTFIMSLARLGGFIAILNLLILFVRSLHRKHFESSLNVQE